MEFKIDLKQVPVYTSPNGYTVVYSAVNGERSVFNKSGRKMSVIDASPKELDEVYNLMKFAEQHRNHALNTFHNDESHS